MSVAGNPLELQRWHQEVSESAYRLKNMEISIPGSDEDLNSYPPEAVQVRNTFIHVSSPGHLVPSMSSCPARQVGKLRDLWQDFW